MNSFSQFNLLSSLQASLKEMKFKEPTEIQNRAVPALLSGKSIVGVSETGSGKTLAYALPLLHTLKKLENDGDPVKNERHPRAVVVVPTRELGEQVSKVFKPFTHTTRLRVRTVLGGTALDVAKRNVSGAFEILVATPGRLVQLIEMSLVNLGDVRFLIFDEADQMLDQSFMSDAMAIEEQCPNECHKGLFSATVSPVVQDLINKLFSEAEVLRSSGSQKLVPTLKTINKTVVDGKRFPVMQKILSEKVQGGTLIFTNTRQQCDSLAEQLKNSGYKCLIYRGEMDKVERRTNLKAFREGKVELLVATDLGSRGLDIEHVSRVINYHLPKEMENYLHRAGRTARAGRTGLVINFVTERDASIMKKIETIRSNGGKRTS
ncbi:MAG: DEAD/DEAH box helicase [Bdellovibrionaceae bacterium]|nr:DEAD/DEAH box helicase [Pseudobdellovibrionaceae bacterium]